MLHNQATPVAGHLTARLRLRPWREQATGLWLSRSLSPGVRLFQSA